MLSTPKIVERPAQSYAGIKARTVMRDIPKAAERLPPELFGWLAQHGIAPAGAPFFKYNVVDMEGELELEWGVPTAAKFTGDARILSGVLPAGRYATALHTGPYDQLMDATRSLLKWVGEQGLALDETKTKEGEVFACRLEIYLNDPSVEPRERLQTELAFKLR
jgi:effector-binding domain-containing protein